MQLFPQFVFKIKCWDDVENFEIRSDVCLFSLQIYSHYSIAKSFIFSALKFTHSLGVRGPICQPLQACARVSHSGCQGPLSQYSCDLFAPIIENFPIYLIPVIGQIRSSFFCFFCFFFRFFFFLKQRHLQNSSGIEIQ